MDILVLQEWIVNMLELAPEELPPIPQELTPVLWKLKEKTEQTEQKRRETERILAFYKASANAMPNPIFIKDDALRFVFFNQAYRDFFGLAEGEHIGERVQELDYLSEEDRKRYHEEDSGLLHSLSSIQYEVPFQTARQGVVESLYWSKGFSVRETGDRGLVGEIVDIAKEKEMQRELTRSMRALEVLMKDAKDASNVDPLTKLYNRNIMEAEVPLIVSEAVSMDRPICAMLIDIDYFKQINDTYGHQCGDEILRNFAQMLRRTFRQQDIAVRYGGDEFMMLLPGAALPQAAAGGERLLAMVRRELLLPDGKTATISVGVTQWRQEDTLEAFIARADEALYHAKKSGRNRVSVGESA